MTSQIFWIQMWTMLYFIHSNLSVNTCSSGSTLLIIEKLYENILKQNRTTIFYLEQLGNQHTAEKYKSLVLLDLPTQQWSRSIPA